MKDLNLIPRSYILAKKKRQKRIYFAMGFTMAGLIVLSMLIVPLKVRWDLQREKNKLEGELKAISGYIETEKQLGYVRGLYKMREEAGNSIVNVGADVITAIEKIEKSAPQKLQVTSFTLSSNEEGTAQIALVGVCYSEDELATLVNGLRKDKFFDSVVIASAKETVAAAGTQNQLGTLNESSKGGFVFNVNIYFKSGK